MANTKAEWIKTLRAQELDIVRCMASHEWWVPGGQLQSQRILKIFVRNCQMFEELFGESYWSAVV